MKKTKQWVRTGDRARDRGRSLCGASAAFAQVKIGVTLSATGPAASLGIPEKNTIALLPKEIGGKTVRIHRARRRLRHRASAVQNTRKLIDEDHVDAIIGSTVTPNSLAMLDAAPKRKTPMISMAASAAIISPMDAKRAWVFKTPQNDSLMADAIAELHGKARREDGRLHRLRGCVRRRLVQGVQRGGRGRTKLKIVTNERFNRTDTSVTGQVLKTMGANPDAVLIAGAGTPSALPAKTLKERGYKGKVYQTHGVANNDFLRVCGKDCEGELLPAGPVLVADQLPDSNPVKKSSAAYKTAYEKAYGAGSVSTFGGHAWDAGQMLQARDSRGAEDRSAGHAKRSARHCAPRWKT